MTPLVTTIIIAIIAAAIGVVVTVVIHRSSAKNRARQIVADAERQALDIKKDKEIEGREEALKITAEAKKPPTSACPRFSPWKPSKNSANCN